MGRELFSTTQLQYCCQQNMCGFGTQLGKWASSKASSSVLFLCAVICFLQKEKLDRQLREKQLYRPVVSPYPKLSQGYSAFKGIHMTARDLGPNGFFRQQAQFTQEKPQEEAQEGAEGRVPCSCPCLYPRSYGLSLARTGLEHPLYQVANLPCLIEPARQPAPHIAKGYFLMPGCLCPFHHKIKYPILSRWGPLLPYYQ